MEPGEDTAVTGDSDSDESVPPHVYEYVLARARAVLDEVGDNDNERRIATRLLWRSLGVDYKKKTYYKRLYQKVYFQTQRLYNERESRDADGHVRRIGFRADKEGGEMKKRFTAYRLEGPLHSKTEAEEKRHDFIQSIPYNLVGTYNCLNLMLRLIDIDMRLKATLKVRTTKVHKGFSLGYTAVYGTAKATGGQAAGGTSGTYQANSNIVDPDFQRDIIELICQIVKVAFGNHVFFKAQRDFYRRAENKHKRQFTFKDTGCSCLWYSTDSRVKNEHHDWNVYGAAFILSPGGYDGGALVFRHKKMPDVVCKKELKLGEVIAGRSTRSPHYVEKVNDGQRSVFVLYGDVRILRDATCSHETNNNTPILQGLV